MLKVEGKDFPINLIIYLLTANRITTLGLTITKGTHWNVLQSMMQGGLSLKT